MDDVSRQNAIKALKQTKMEIAGEYGMNYEDAFEIIENASNKGVLEGYFKKLEKKKVKPSKKDIKNIEKYLESIYFEYLEIKYPVTKRAKYIF